MSDKRYDVLDRFSPYFETPDPSIQGFLRRRERKRRTQRVAAGVVGVAIFVVPVLLFATLLSLDRKQTPAGTGPASPSVPSDVPKVDYVLDLRTGEMSPLPIIRDVGASVRLGQYAASPDGSLLAYVGVKENGSRQIFVAPVDGRHPQQVTHLPRDFSPASPAWSPDGTKLVYEGYGSGAGRNIFVLDVATGESTQVIDPPGPFDLGPSCPTCLVFPQFTPDGSSIIYTGEAGGSVNGVARIVPAAGGRSSIFLSPAEGLDGVFATSLSPDGSLVTFQASGWPGPGFHCGPCRFLAKSDGTDRRVIPGGESSPAGTWSPDGSRIVAAGAVSNRIIVVDVATGEATPVAEGLEAIWLDNHTLLVEADPTL
jgi:Tol biopolymer transport system component